MSMLTELYLPYNNFSGTLPSNRSPYSIIPQLQILSVSSNQLSGNIPYGLSHFHDLRALSLSENKFSGKIPGELGNLKQLTLLYLSNNFLAGTMLTCLSNFTKICFIIPYRYHTIHLGGKFLAGMIPSSLGNLTNMLQLDISFNRVNGTIPEELGSLANILTLFLSNNFGMTGTIPLSQIVQSSKL